MPHHKLRSRKLLINLLNLVLLIKIVNARTVPKLSLHSRDAEVSTKFNISQYIRDKEFLKADASAIVKQISNLPLNSVRKPGENHRLASQPKKINKESYGSKIVLGILQNVKETQTLKPLEDQIKSQTIVKYFDQENYNGLKINPIVVADIYEDSEKDQKNRIRNRKEIIDLEQEESPIKPDSHTKEETDKEIHVADFEEEPKTNGGRENASEDEENGSIKEPYENERIKWNKEYVKPDDENRSTEGSEENESLTEDEESGNIKEDAENDEIKSDVVDDGSKDEEHDSIIKHDEHQNNEDGEDNQGIKEDESNEDIEDEEEHKENPVYNKSIKEDEEYKEHKENSSNTEDEQPHEDDKFESSGKIKESTIVAQRDYENEERKHEDEPYDQTNIEKDEINNHNKDTSYIDNQEETPQKYEENENSQTGQLSKKESDQNSNIEVDDKAPIADKEDTKINQDKNDEHTHADAKKKKKGGKHSSGKGKEHHSHVYKHKGEKGLKAYKGHHEEAKGSKGHHDKEHHGKKYLDEKGLTKKHHEERGHHGEHHKGEKGEKAYDFAEDGKHSKGHSTKGEHNIHKKDEYNKKEVFYDEHHEGGENEKHGVFEFEDHFEKGGFKKGSHHKKGDHEDHYGKKSKHAKGKHFNENKGHKKAGGHDEHHNHHSKYGKKKASSGKKHWEYEKGTGGGHGGKKKYSAQSENAESTPQHIREDSSIHSSSKDGNNQEYINHNNNDRSATDDEVEYTPKKESTDVDHKEVQEEEISVNEDEGEPSEIKKEELPINTNYNYDKPNTEESNLPEINEESIDTDKENVDSEEQSEELTNAAQKPKIYVIIPDEYEKGSQVNEKYSEKEPFSSEYKLKSNKNSKFPTESFSEEHRKKLTEKEYVVHENGENVKNKRMSPIYKNCIRETIANKPRQFSVA